MNRFDNVFMDLALRQVKLNTNPGSGYAPQTRQWQGTSSIERSQSGRLWIATCRGGTNEGPNNYVGLIRSDDGAKSWTQPLLVIDPPDRVRAFDPCLWHDPLGRLWLFWAQSYGMFDGRCGVWAAVCADPDGADPVWTEPRRIANGIMNNKPTVARSGEWLMPIALWAWADPGNYDLSEERYSNVYASSDQGETFTLLGRADIADRSIDQHMIVERNDGSLWMLVRLFGGIGESFSYDGGKTWSAGNRSKIAGPNARFFIRRLQSGRLLLVNHYWFTGRNNLTALLSDDDGATWPHALLLDERPNVSSPDAVESGDGVVCVVYDRERVQEREILMAVFTEEDILRGACVSDKARLKVVING